MYADSIRLLHASQIKVSDKVIVVGMDLDDGSKEHLEPDIRRISD